MVTASSSNPFTAGASATGYLYQCRYALLLLLERCKDEPAAAISIEKFDDISFDEAETPRKMLQLKHHLGSAPDLSDASPDLWKSLRVWSEGIASKRFTVPPTMLGLVTTAACADGSAASFLRKNDCRNPAEAHQLLVAAAGKMTGKGLKAARESFLGLAAADQLQMLESLYVMDRSPDINDTADEIRRSVGFPVRRDLMNAFLERLEGWWFAEVILRLSGKTTEPIAGTAIWLKMDDISKSFREDSLPVDYLTKEPTSLPPVVEDTRTFVRQLLLIGMPPKSINWARIYYYRAYAQRSRWLKDNLLAADQLDTYDVILKEEWQRRFDRMEESHDDGAEETVLQASGREIYNFLQDNPRPIRPNCTEEFVGRGSYQMLAERMLVGWHRDFRRLLGSPEEPAMTQ